MNVETSAALQIAGSDGTRTLGTAMDAKQIKDISKALADETQLAILKTIAATDNLTCGDLASLRGVTPATISHHLKILRQR
jgi:DNA-binding transcriptional ArsR family regulator